MRRRLRSQFALAGCAALPLLTAIPAKASDLYGESPECAAAVRAGSLPPVEERLPPNPEIVQPGDSIGRYGGTLRMALLGWNDIAWLDRTLAGESLVRWDPQWTRIIPNLAQSWSVNADATEYTFRLRRGVHWSDGAPFGADDIVFWNEAIFRTGIVHPPVPWLRAAGRPVTVAKIDDHTVVFRFAAPNGLLLYGLAGAQGDEPVVYPEHYLRPFHPSNAPSDLARAMAENGVTNGVDLIRQKLGLAPRADGQRSRWRVAEIPRLAAWQLEPGCAFGMTNRIVARRNPYYWKVDTAGHQLPYIDRVEFAVVTNAQELAGLAAQGRIDLGERSLTTPDLLPFLREHAQEGGYRFFRIITDSGNLAAICLNLTHPDPVKRALYQDRHFRIGLSHAIDRPRIIHEVLRQPGVPCQVAPRPDSPLYHAQLASQFTEYDLEKANEHLNQAGLMQRDAQGFRVDATGRRVVVRAEIPSSHAIRIAALQIVRENWAAVGIELQLVTEETGDLIRKRSRNEHDAAVWAGDGGFDVIMDPRYYLPLSDESMQCIAWARWANGQQDRLAEVPPERVRVQLDLYRQVRATASPQERAERMMTVLDLAAAEFPVIGLCTADDITGLASRRLHNVPDIMMSSGRSFLAPAPVNPCQFHLDPESGGAP